MSELARFGVSLERDLLGPFDELCRKRGYGSRSEAIRDLIRSELASEQVLAAGECSGTLTLIYDHHKYDLARRIMEMQHESHDLIVAGMHVHLDHDNCMETLVLRGETMLVAQLAQNLLSCRGVKFGAFNPAPNGSDII